MGSVDSPYLGGWSTLCIRGGRMLKQGLSATTELGAEDKVRIASVPAVPLNAVVGLFVSYLLNSFPQ